MSDSNQEAVFVFANCAGAARGEDPDPETLGRFLTARLKDKNVAAIGLSEVIISTAGAEALPKCSWGMFQQLPPFAGGANIVLNDLDAFEAGYGHKADKKYYLSHLNSRNHNHPDALKNKWSGEKASMRIADQFNYGNDVYQGTGVLLFSHCDGQEGFQFRPAGTDPVISTGIDNPLDYLGNRDTEPRSAILFRELKAINDLTVDIVFFQLETNSNDRRVAPEDVVDSGRDLEGIGTDHRIEQIDKLCSTLNNVSGRPIILMGDFNARPGTKELDHLCNHYGFLQVLPKNTPTRHESTDWGAKHTYDCCRIDRPDYSKTEQAQGWSYSHLRHKILIDHAFVKGIDRNKWDCDLQAIELSDRVSDHNPIVLSISGKGNGQK